MTSKTFTSGTVIDSAWLNDVNTVVYNTFPAQSTNPTAVASVNGGQLAGLRNKIINGGMLVAQRGNLSMTGNSIPSIFGGCDRFLTYTFGWTTATATIQQTANGLGTYGVAQGIVGLTTTGAGGVEIATKLEQKDTAGLSGKLVTASIKVYQTTGVNQTYYIRLQKANSIDNFGATTVLGSSAGQVVPSGVLTTVTFSLSNLDGNTGVLVECFSILAAAVTAKDFYFTDFQLEVGSVATTFEQRPYGMELALCQRYYQFLPAVSGRWQSATTTFSGAAPLPMQMRTTPTVSLVGVPVCNEFAIASRNITAIAGSGFGAAGGSIDLTTSAATLGNGGNVSTVGFTSSANINLSAEL